MDESIDGMLELEEQFGPSSTSPKFPKQTASDDEIIEYEVDGVYFSFQCPRCIINLGTQKGVLVLYLLWRWGPQSYNV